MAFRVFFCRFLLLLLLLGICGRVVMDFLDFFLP